MTGRDYNYFGADMFYDQEMRDKAAAEGALMAILAGDGVKYVFPLRGHDKMFQENDCVAQCMMEVDDAAAALQNNGSAV